MSGKSKHCHKVEAVSIIFGFVPETARKRQAYSIRWVKASAKKFYIGQETSRRHAYNKWHRRTAEKCIDTYSVITIDKSVGKHHNYKTSSHTIWSTALNKLEPSESHNKDLKFEWLIWKRREKAVNTDFIFNQLKNTIGFCWRPQSCFKWIQ